MTEKKLLLNDQITASCQTCRPKPDNQTLQTIKKKKLTLLGSAEFLKTSKIAIRLIFLKGVCPFVPPFTCFVLFIPSFNVLSGYFYVSLSLVVAATV